MVGDLCLERCGPGGLRVDEGRHGRPSLVPGDAVAARYWGREGADRSDLRVTTGGLAHHRHVDADGVVGALLVWLVLYAGIFAVLGFVAVVLRGFTGRRWSNLRILRTCSAWAFVTSAVIWFVLVIWP